MSPSDVPVWPRCVPAGEMADRRLWLTGSLTGYIKVDQPLVFAGFVYSQTFVHDGDAGVADVEPAHDLPGRKENACETQRSISEQQVHAAV